MAEAAENLEQSAAETTETTETQQSAETQETSQEKETQQERSETIASGGADDTKETKAPADWPEDWRDKLAGEDEKLRKRLDRFTSPADILKSWRAAEQKISSGEFKQALPENAKPEEIEQWRKDNGIPDKPEGYLETLPDGLVVGEQDKPVVDSFLTKAHESNMRPEDVQTAIGWYYEMQDDQLAQRSEQDKSFRQESDDELRAKWGNEYRSNINAISNWLDSGPEGLKEALLEARTKNGAGELLGDDPAVLEWLASTVRELNPVATVVPGAENSASAIQDEKANLEAMMGNHNSEYWRGANAERNQKRYLQLVEAEERLRKRG